MPTATDVEPESCLFLCIGDKRHLRVSAIAKGDTRSASPIILPQRRLFVYYNGRDEDISASQLYYAEMLTASQYTWCRDADYASILYLKIGVFRFNIKDDSGELKLTLWGDQAKGIENGKKIKISGGFVKDFKGEKQLNLTRQGKIEVE